MQIDKALLFGLAENTEQQYIVEINGTKYDVDKIDLHYAETPVSRPTTRGGVYFSDKMGFKIKAKLSDVSIAKSLSKTMLGPNTDFEQIQLFTTINHNGAKKELKILANLANYVQKRDSLELNLMVVGTELAN